MGTNKTLALVSGANRGIGLAIAAGLAKGGCQVLLGCRDLSRGEEAAKALLATGVKVQPVQLDTTDEASVAALAALIADEYGHLDVLINNAGIGLDYDPRLSVMERIEQTVAVNIVGTVRLTEAMIPLLAGSKSPRIVNLSSELASFGLRHDPSWPHADKKMPTYAASKAAVNSLTVSYAESLADKGIKVNAICPGYTATEATNFMGTRTTEQAATIAIDLAIRADCPTGTFVNDQGPLPW